LFYIATSIGLALIKKL